jgi:hypothetical protein
MKLEEVLKILNEIDKQKQEYCYKAVQEETGDNVQALNSLQGWDSQIWIDEELKIAIHIGETIDYSKATESELRKWIEGCYPESYLS